MSEDLDLDAEIITVNSSVGFRFKTLNDGNEVEFSLSGYDAQKLGYSILRHAKQAIKHLKEDKQE